MRRRVVVIGVIGLLVGFVLGRLVGWVGSDPSGLDSGQWFDLWMTVLGVLGTFLGIWLAAVLALRGARRTDERSRVREAANRGFEMLNTTFWGLFQAATELGHQGDGSFTLDARSRARALLVGASATLQELIQMDLWRLPLAVQPEVHRLWEAVQMHTRTIEVLGPDEIAAAQHRFTDLLNWVGAIREDLARVVIDEPPVGGFGATARNRFIERHGFPYRYDDEVPS